MIPAKRYKTLNWKIKGKWMNVFLSGFRAMLPITAGVIPFGAVMGTVFSEAGLNLVQALSMNVMVFAGAAQLATVDLMQSNTSSVVVIFTGLLINIRFLLYSAALSPLLHNSKLLTKLVSAYCLTDQSYSVTNAKKDDLNNSSEVVSYYLGASLCMVLAWQIAVVCGYTFGNFAPSSWALDYAIPLSFVALVMPSLKNKFYIMVAVFSSVCSLLLASLPYNLGLIVTALLGIGLGAWFTRKKVAK